MDAQFSPDQPVIVMACRHARLLPQVAVDITVHPGTHVICWRCDSAQLVLVRTTIAHLTEMGLSHLI